MTEHLLEIRKRLMTIIIFFFLAFFISYYFIEQIYNFLLNPLLAAYGEESGKRIIFTGLTEAFITYIRLAFLTALFFTTPFLLTQFYLFISPALYKKEKKLILFLLFLVPLLFILGSLLLYYVILPAAFKFFIGFEITDNINNLPIELEARISEYLSLIIKLIFGFGAAFQIPVFLLILIKTELITINSLKSKRKYWILLIFIIAAILTPPDIFSQVFLALPMILLYEITLLIAKKITK